MQLTHGAPSWARVKFSALPPKLIRCSLSCSVLVLLPHLFHMPSKRPASDHRVSVTHPEFALAAHLHLHPWAAYSYGIKKCNCKTTIGSMLQQTLHA